MAAPANKAIFTKPIAGVEPFQTGVTPIHNGIGIHAQFLAQQVEQLVLKEKVLSLSGDSFSVKTVAGQAIFQVKGEALSISGRKHFMDAQGVQLFDIRKEHLALHTTFYCENPKQQRIFQVKSKFSIGSAKAIGTFTSPTTGKEEELLMKGDFFDSSANITDSTGKIVATIDRQFLKVSEVFAGQQTYVVSIQPGVDMALIVAMCICLDEKRNEK